MRKRKWSAEDLNQAAIGSKSIRQVIGKLGLVEAGGNYSQIKKYLHFYKIDISHFNGKGWRKGSKVPMVPKANLNNLLILGSDVQSFKLKKRLFEEKIKSRKCELCEWAEKSVDGRVPLELDHINGNRMDNRLDNLRVLCPNCHSLQPTHRGRNKKHY